MAVTTFRADIEHHRSKRGKGRRSFFFSFFFLFIMAASIGGYLLLDSLFRDMPALPSNEELWTVGRDPAIEFRTSDGRILLHRGPYYGEAIDPETLPEHVVEAFIAGEDKQFYKHNGIDIGAIFRAAIANWKAGSTVQGGSTLTQQLVKNLVLTPEQTLRRKAQEMRLAIELETRLSKEEILALYLNRIYLGNRAYGIDAASFVYFGKTAHQLTLAEASFLAALPKAPTRLSTEVELTGARRRQSYILSQMVDEGYATFDEAQEAASTELVFAPPQEPENSDFGYVADYVSQQMRSLLPRVPDDAIVTITLNPEIQAIARQTLDAQIAARGKSGKVRNGAVMIMDLNGRVLAMVGGTNYALSKYNRATQAMRQPGSAFKPFVYAAAMESGLTPETIRVDSRTYITSTWAPRNYSDSYVGPVMLKDALAHSLNTVAAKLTQEVGQDKVVAMAHRLGLGTDLISVPAIALGADETTLFDMTRAYGTFARMGKRLDPFIIEKVEDTRGRLHYFRKPYPTATVLDKRSAADMDRMLRRVVTDGSGWRADIDGMRVAGKTGTSQNWRDAWFIGYTQNYVTGVWMGNDDNAPMARITGGTIPAETWNKIMSQLKAKGLLEEDGPIFEDRKLSAEDQKRADFYAELSAAFAATRPARIAGIDPAIQSQ